MKKILFIAAIPLLLAACDAPHSQHYNSELGKVLEGSHYLCNLPYQIDSTEGTQNSLFAIKGDQLLFSWQLPDSTFTVSKLPLEKVRMRFDPTNEKPFVRFRWVASDNSSDLAYAFEFGQIKYMIINCKETDFPSNIKVTSL